MLTKSQIAAYKLYNNHKQLQFNHVPGGVAYYVIKLSIALLTQNKSLSFKG